ncbi:MAG TPA: DUF1521 domain-containing protein [Pyrinomonadaceae bacterium]|jgi:hypothetical protein
MSENTFVVVNQFNVTDLGPDPAAGGAPDAGLLAELEGAAVVSAGAGDDYAAALSRLDAAGVKDLTRYALGQCAPVSAPDLADCCHPAGGLQTYGDSIYTPGGYRIEMLGRYEWKITGPDGKWIRVHGDPHVDEGDREGTSDWDFKRDTTFVLGDGTRVNVTTAPGGAEGMTVTSKIEVVSGFQSVTAEGIGEGKGSIGEVGFHFADTFTGDVVTMGAETDDWTFRGREIVGSRDGGASFALGDVMRSNDGRFYVEVFAYVTWVFESFFGEWRLNDWGPNGLGCNPYSLLRTFARQADRRDRADGERARRDDERRLYMESLAEAFRAVAHMFDALARLERAREELSGWRGQRCRLSA